MDLKRRQAFNAAFSDELFARMMNHLENRVGPIPFRVAETPLLVTPALRDGLVRDALAIVSQLAVPARQEKLRRAVPARYDMPGMGPLPNTVQVDFGLVQGPGGQLEGRLIELQGFPSLYALMPMMAEAWAHAFSSVPGLEGPWECLLGEPAQTLQTVGRTLLGGHDPEEVALVDYEPQKQKTSPDFWATKLLFGIDTVCVTRLKVVGRRLFREKDGRRIQVKRIYNRLVFDELEVKKVPVPFNWSDELDVTWCSHPNWYWAWSKYSLPHLDHPAVPRTRLLSGPGELPEDLSGQVLKPLFSFAGSGVVVDVTPEAIAAIPEDQRDRWVLQEKVTYAPAIRMPDGNGVKAEVRVMLARPPDEAWFTPVLLLVRLARGKMLGVDFNKNMTWVGGSVAMWPSGD